MNSKEFMVEEKKSSILEKAARKAGLSQNEFEIIKKWLADQLISQEFAKLGQGGHTNTQVPLRKVFIDLPIKSNNEYSDERELFLSNLFKNQPINLKKSLKLSQEILSLPISDIDFNEQVENNNFQSVRTYLRKEKWGATILIGGPGQGKSTLSQLACQFHRAKLIHPFTNELTTPQRELVNSFFCSNQSKEFLEPPKTDLLPIQIVLPEFAEWAARPNVSPTKSSLPIFLQYIEELPSSKNLQLEGAKLFDLMCQIPSLLVLDGFDEVGAINDRELIVNATRELLNTLADYSASSQILATTRPQGYADELSRIGIRIQKVVLAPLLKEEALEYADRLIKAKISGVDQQAKAFRQITEAATESSTERLLTTPLQVTILTALIQQLGRAPKERWNLFSRFFSYTFDREIERGTYASALLADHRAHIERIHARVGLLLQVEAERVGGASARMSKKRLEDVISAVLSEDEIEGDQQKELITDIATAAENRLVFLVEPEPGKFGFEIRSLQEFMAAWALTSGRDSEIEARLNQISKPPMFRNVILFIASKLFSESSPLRDILADSICRNLDEDISDDLARISKAGALLALETLEEGSALTQPKRARALANKAVNLLQIPDSYQHIRLTKVINDETRSILTTALEMNLIDSNKRNSFSNSSSWTCIVYATNRNEKWAIDLGNIYIKNSIISKDFFQPLCSSNILLGDWISGKIEENSSNIDPYEFISVYNQYPLRIPKNPNWVNWLMGIFNILDEFRHFNLMFVNKIEQHKKILDRFVRPTYDAPNQLIWKIWIEIADFETKPSLVKLISILEKIKEHKNIEYWKEKKVNFSWPLFASITYIKNETDLKNLIKELASNKLGNENDWLIAQKNWDNKSINLPNLIESLCLSSDHPWTLELLHLSPPALSINPAHLCYDILYKSRIKDKDTLLEKSNNLLTDCRSPAVKKYLSILCLALWKKSSLKTQKKYNNSDLKKWITCAPDFQSLLINRPKSLSVLQWSELLDIFNLENDIIFSKDPLESTLSAFIELPSHPALISLITKLCHKHLKIEDAFNTHDIEIIKKNIKDLDLKSYNDPLTIANIIILKIYIGEINPSQEKEYIYKIYEAYKLDSSLTAKVIGATRKSKLPLVRVESIISNLYNIFSDIRYTDSDLIHQEIKELLQKRTSGLDSTSNWNKLALPLPFPQQTYEKQNIGGISNSIIHFKSIQIEEVGGIKQLSVNFNSPEKDKGQWIVLLGPNGSGKTTLLKSFAIALRNIKNPSIWPKGVFGSYLQRITNDQSKDIKTSNIQITLGDGTEHRTLIRSYNNSLDFSQLPEQNQPYIFPVFAYGCRRGSALGGAARQVNLNEDDGPEIATLFDESADLIQAETWLVTLEGDINKNSYSRIIFENVINALKILMDLNDIEVFDQKLWIVEKDRNRIPFSCLSDGYLTNAGWFLDLIARWLKQAEHYNYDVNSDFLSNMTGLVLIDEIDLHLHPQWQIEIISRTKKILPKMSFIVSTHNPLTLVGAKSEEILILKREDELVRVSSGIENPILLTGGQIYRQYFDIRDIYPNDLGRLLQRFSYLASYSLRNNEEEIELYDIKDKLSQAGIDHGWEITPRSQASF